MDQQEGELMEGGFFNFHKSQTMIKRPIWSTKHTHIIDLTLAYLFLGEWFISDPKREKKKKCDLSQNPIFLFVIGVLLLSDFQWQILIHSFLH